MKEYVIKIGGTPYRLAQMTVRQTQELLDYAKKVLPDPVDAVLDTANKLPDSMKEKFLDKHLDAAFEEKKKIGSINGTDMEAVFKTPAGFKKMCHLMFQRHQPQLTEDDVERLLEQYVDEQGPEIFKEILHDGTKVPVTEEEAERRYFRRKGGYRTKVQRPANNSVA